MSNNLSAHSHEMEWRPIGPMIMIKYSKNAVALVIECLSLPMDWFMPEKGIAKDGLINSWRC